MHRALHGANVSQQVPHSRRRRGGDTGRLLVVIISRHVYLNKKCSSLLAAYAEDTI